MNDLKVFKYVAENGSADGWIDCWLKWHPELKCHPKALESIANVCGGFTKMYYREMNYSKRLEKTVLVLAPFAGFAIGSIGRTIYDTYIKKS